MYNYIYSKHKALIRRRTSILGYDANTYTVMLKRSTALFYLKFYNMAQQQTCDLFRVDPAFTQQ